MSEGGAFGFLAPRIGDWASAQKASNLGALAAAIAGFWTLAVLTVSIVRIHAPVHAALLFSLSDAVIFLALAFAIGRRSRVAAVAALVLFALEQAAVILKGGIIGAVIPVVMILLFVSGIRGTFACRRYRRESGQ